MKTLLSCVLFLIGIVIQVQIYQYNNFNTALAHKDHMLDLSNQEIKILRDWVDDYGQKIDELSARKTYEEGIADGITNSHNASYVRGYHAATANENTFVPIIASDGNE